MVLERLAYEIAWKAVDRQQDALNQLRSRTGILLAAGSITASFLGSQALARGELGALASIALAAFVLSIASCIYVLVPKARISFWFSGTALYSLVRDRRDDEAAIYLQMADWLELQWDGNQRRIARLERWFAGASLALIVQIVCWAVVLAGRI